MIWIYGLVDPASGFIRYVGQSGDPEARLKQHECLEVNEAGQWVRTLKAAGLRATLVRLELVDPDQANEREQHWQAHFTKVAPLLNASLRRGHVRKHIDVRPSNAGAAALLEIMRSRRVSEGWIGTEVGIRQQCVSKLVRGASRPRLSTALQLQSKFGIALSAWETSL